MIGSLWTGISGLSSFQSALDNESNNIANVNTVGYKASRISFADQMYQDSIGKGSKVIEAEKLYEQGSLKVTGIEYDMALNGEGFFTVKSTNSRGTAENYYTRAGNFRMGDNGTLQDATGNEVQGWVMQDIDPQNDVVTTNPNHKTFTSDYTELLSSKIINHSNYIETITAKATDYTQTAKADSSVIFEGAGWKSESSKISDVETLIINYTSWLEKLQDNPDGPSASSTAQISQINFESNSDGIINKEGDQIYVYIDGNKYSQNYISSTASQEFKMELYDYDQSLPLSDQIGYADPSGTLTDDESALYDREYSRIETYKALADTISNEIPGLRAYMVNESGGSNSDVLEDSDNFELSTNIIDMQKGIIQIESLIPGVSFNITEVGETSGTTTLEGSYQTSTLAVEGSGRGALESARDALAEAISGKQQDVYTPEDLNLDGTEKDFNYKITIYDKELDRNVTIPEDNSTSEDIYTVLTNITTVDDMVERINSSSEFSKYIEAININDNLVIQTLDHNYDVEFTGELTESPGLGINLNEVVDNGSYEFTINVDGTPETFTINTSDTFSDEEIYNEISSQIDIYNASATNKLKVSSLYEGFFRIYPDDSDISLNGSSVSITSETLPPNPTVSAVPTYDPTEMEESQITIGTVTAGDTYSFNILGETISYTASGTPDIDEIRDGLIDEINSNLNLIGKVTATGSGSTIDLQQITLTDPDNPTGLLISSGTNTTSSVTSSFDAGDRQNINITFTPALDSSYSSSVFTLNVEGVDLEVMTSQTPTVTELATLLQNEVAQNNDLSSKIEISTDGTYITITRRNDEYGTVAFSTTPSLAVSSLQDPLDDFQTVTYSISSSNEFTPLEKNYDYSGRQGAGAEFIEIVNTVNQTSTQDSIQLKLNTLGITDSAFGEFSVDDTGVVTMKQDGAEFAIGQVSIALFTDTRGLDAIGDNLLAKTNESGEPIYNLNNDDMGKIESNALELSTADLSESLVNLMVFQRAFEASSKSITTADDILNTLINMKK